MPRRSGVGKRDVLPDSKYNSTVVTKLINQIMLKGERSVASTIVYEAFNIMEDKMKSPAFDIFNKALENVKPHLEVKARRVSGSNMQVPIEVRPDRRQTLGIRWIVSFARKRSEKTMKERLSGELMDAYNNAGGAFKKKEDTHRMAEANKAFAMYNWGKTKK